MGKKSCCHKFEKSGKQCKSCPITLMASLNKESGKKKENKKKKKNKKK